METKNISRRNFIKLSGMTGTMLALGFYSASGEAKKIITPETAENLGIELNAWISIDTAGKVTIINHRAEMGQGSFQSVPQIIAEELEVNLDDVNIIFGKGNQKRYGSQITGGSSTIRGSYENLLKLSASAREMMITAAATKWNVPAAECYAENGFVIHKPSGKKLGYGELVADASKLQPPQEVKLKDPKDYKILRKPLPRQDTPGKTNGTTIFGLDKRLPGMLYAVVERSPKFRGKIKSYDDTTAKAVPGVKHVLKVQMGVFDYLCDGVAVVADNLWAAMQGRKALKIEWDDSGFEHLSSDTLYARMNSDLSKEGFSQPAKGNPDTALGQAAKKIEAVYETPYESHSCMEPLNCIAHVYDDKCEIWGPIQGPDWVQSDISERLGLPLENVTVNMTFLGGGFGRKAFTDYPHEAVVISKAINAPVQVVWTREDDMRQGPFRPGAVYKLTGGLDKSGSIVALKTKMAAQNMDHQNPGANKKSANTNTTEGLPEGYFESIPNLQFADVPTESPIPVMWWRSVYSSTNGFAYESFMDEMALAAGKDPLDFRRTHLTKPRYQALIAKLESVTQWKSRGKNTGWGVALTECFSSIVAEAVKVSRTPAGKLTIDKVVAVMDCGWYVNPDIIRAQVEGSIIMALGASVHHATHFAEGKAVETNFDKYKMPRISDTPEIEVHIMDNHEKAGGVGEPGLPPFAAALTNAIFDLTGKRIRTLPFKLEEA